MSRQAANVDEERIDETLDDNASTISNPSSCQTYQDMESIRKRHKFKRGVYYRFFRKLSLTKRHFDLLFLADETFVRVKEDELENQIDDISNTLRSCMEGLEKKGYLFKQINFIH